MTPYQPVRWGILGAADIALKKVVPAMKPSERSTVVAIASRNSAKAAIAASALGIATSYGSYEELIDDSNVEAIYNPLPNHLHVPWTIRAMEAGKHVLCEKPLALSAAEARQLLRVREHTGLHVGEAFMVRTHPQWIGVKKLIDDGRIGDLRLIVGHFSYFRRDASDIRSRPDWGGGALLDIGCYPITMSRWLFGAEPEAVVGQLERDPDFGIDRLGSALMRFPTGQATFTCAGQLASFQRMQIFGTKARIEVEIPFNAPPDRSCRVFLDDGRLFADESAEAISFPAVDQYLLQADRFSDAVRGVGEVPVSLEDAIANMAVIDAVFRSTESARWELPSSRA